jgi:hypothetical protein
MAEITDKSIIASLLLYLKVSEGYMLTEAMKSAGLASSVSEITQISASQFAGTFEATVLANKIGMDSMGSATIQGPIFHHFPTVCSYISASNSKEESILRTTVVIIFYSVCGVMNCVSVEFATAVSLFLAIFAAFMASH